MYMIRKIYVYYVSHFIIKIKHEKNKKKRGSYSGGEINTSVNSIKFPDDIW